MQNFEFCNPTKIVFGKGVENGVGQECAKYSKKVLLHYGQGSVVRSGLLDRVKKSLDEAGVSYVELGGVKPNPRIELVREAVELCKKEEIGFILAVGGGSVIDSAKATAMGVVYGKDPWDLYDNVAAPVGAIGVGVVLTIPAAGSESSNSSVLTNEALVLKRSCDVDYIYPKFAFLNPELTFTMPKYQIACGIADIMAHIMERYFTQVPNNGVTDRLAEGLLKNMIHFGPKAVADPENYDVRAEIMWNGTLAHNNLIQCGRQPDWASHPIEHELSAEYDIAHGGGLAIIYPAWMRYVYKDNLQHFIRFATEVWGVEYDKDNPEATAYEGIERLEQFFNKIGLPTRLEDAKIEADDAKLRFLAERCDRNENNVVGHFVQLDSDDVEKIYHLAKKES